MLLAHHLAGWSIEKGRRVGAVIVGPDNEIRSTGFNGLPRGVRDDLEERHSRVTGAKYIWSCHAEQNAIFNAARVGVALKGCSIYVPWFPCVECTKAIIQSGITELVAYAPDRPNSNWAEDFSIAGVMLKEAEINVRLIPRLAELGAQPIDLAVDLFVARGEDVGLGVGEVARGGAAADDGGVVAVGGEDVLVRSRVGVADHAEQ